MTPTLVSITHSRGKTTALPVSIAQALGQVALSQTHASTLGRFSSPITSTCHPARHVMPNSSRFESIGARFDKISTGVAYNRARIDDTTARIACTSAGFDHLSARSHHISARFLGNTAERAQFNAGFAWEEG
jgi:hypothetical protein